MSDPDQTTMNGTEPATANGSPKPSIPIFRIEDLESFRKAGEQDREVALLYFFKTLNYLIELTYEVSRDFFRRPQFYTDLKQPTDGDAKAGKSGVAEPPDIAGLLAKLR